MRYMMTQRFMSLGDHLTVRDERGNERYHFKGPVFALRHSLTFTDLTGTELLVIRQRLLTMRATYDTTRQGSRIAFVRRRYWQFLRTRFDIEIPGEESPTVEGNIFDYDYRIRRGPEIIATVSKRWFTIRDQYGIDITTGQDEHLVLAIAAVIDLAQHNTDSG